MAQQDRRQAKRRPVLESFSVFISLPKVAPVRLKVIDVSEMGMGFEIASAQKSAIDRVLQSGEKVEILFHMNPSFSLHLNLKVVRVEDQKNDLWVVGCQFSSSPKERGEGFDAFIAFVHLVDQLARSASF